jgi:hypothetical protein
MFRAVIGGERPTTEVNAALDSKRTDQHGSMRTKPTCGRPTRSGEPCRAVLRYSAALGEHTPSCRKHMTDAERRAMDANPPKDDVRQQGWKGTMSENVRG